uniref:Uncharacterized protein n=1 Tax=Erythrolobus australicus TaxID=1077150 RepID=A0A7S1TMY7_9RHOD|mmetsp:Transcript_990/g.2825  ORF Transcript_990/g.2825 Transcript_990/m.2825 type:complete len:106 (+) Transcript_990:232-549(+)
MNTERGLHWKLLGHARGAQVCCRHPSLLASQTAHASLCAMLQTRIALRNRGAHAFVAEEGARNASLDQLKAPAAVLSSQTSSIAPSLNFDFAVNNSVRFGYESKA